MQANQETLTNLNNQEYLNGQHKGITTEEIINLKVSNPNLTLAQACRLLNCSRINIYDHLQRKGLTWSNLHKQLQAFQDNKPNILALKQYQVINHLNDDKLKACSARDLAVTFGILHDHERTERGLDKQGPGDTNVQVNINFDPSLIPGSGGTVQLQASTNETKQIEGGGGEANPGTPK